MCVCVCVCNNVLVSVCIHVTLQNTDPFQTFVRLYSKFLLSVCVCVCVCVTMFWSVYVYM